LTFYSEISNSKNKKRFNGNKFFPPASKISSRKERRGKKREKQLQTRKKVQLK
jgi:hypothetical protein